MERQLETTLPIGTVDIPERMRRIDAATATALGRNIAENGQYQPILVRASNECANRYVLIDGAHRLQGCLEMGLETVFAILVEASEAEARLMEIDANLARRELTAFDRMRFIATLRETWEGVHGAAHGGDRRSKKVQENQAAKFATWSKAISERIGMAERSIRHDLTIWGAISEEARQLIPATPLEDNAQQLRALSEIPDAEAQVAIVEAIAASETPLSVSAAQAQVEGLQRPTLTSHERQLRTLTDAWERASGAVRTQFMATQGLRKAEGQAVPAP